MISLEVLYKGTPRVVLNKYLLDKQKCWKNVTKIKHAHWFKVMLYEMITETENEEMISSLAKDLTEVEYYLQELWKFPKDEKFHRFWEYPRCACPKLDNRYSYPYRKYISVGCILHREYRK